MSNEGTGGSFFKRCVSWEEGKFHAEWKVCTTTLTPFAFAAATLVCLLFFRTIAGFGLTDETRRPYLKALTEAATNMVALQTFKRYFKIELLGLGVTLFTYSLLCVCFGSGFLGTSLKGDYLKADSDVLNDSMFMALLEPAIIGLGGTAVGITASKIMELIFVWCFCCFSSNASPQQRSSGTSAPSENEPLSVNNI